MATLFGIHMQCSDWLRVPRMFTLWRRSARAKGKVELSKKNEKKKNPNKGKYKYYSQLTCLLLVQGYTAKWHILKEDIC